MIITDDARYDTYMTPNTKQHDNFPYPLINLSNKLLKTGVSFENAFANFPSCGPSRQSFLTGRLTDTLQIWNLKEQFRSKGTAPRSMPQYFMSRNYTTVSVGKIFHFDNNYGVDENLSWNSASLGEFGATDSKCPKTNAFPFGSYFCSCTKDSCADRLIAKTVTNLLPALTKAHFQKNSPFFLAVGFRRPHLDWRVLDEYLTTPTMIQAYTTLNPEFDQPASPYFPWAGQVPSVAYFQCTTINQRGELKAKRMMVTPNNTLSPAMTRKMRHGYWKAVSYMDQNLGIVLDAIDNIGMRNESIIVFLSDHGWSLGERAFWCKQSLQDASLRVPFVFSIPWIQQDNLKLFTRLKTPVELIDMYPTLVSLVGEPIPSDGCAQGKDLSPLILAKSDLLPAKTPNLLLLQRYALSTYPRCLPIKAKTGKKLNVEYLEECTDLPSSRISFMGYSIRSQNWRYTEWRYWNRTFADWSPSGLYKAELYDHTGDTDAPNISKYENINLIGKGLDIEITHRIALRKRILEDPSYINYHCGIVETTSNNGPNVDCTKLKIKDDCYANFQSKCDWFEGYGCQQSTFCGFKTKSWNVVSQIGSASASNDLSDWEPVYHGQPGCKQYSSRCVWFTKRGCVARGVNKGKAGKD